MLQVVLSAYVFCFKQLELSYKCIPKCMFYIFALHSFNCNFQLNKQDKMWLIVIIEFYNKKSYRSFLSLIPFILFFLPVFSIRSSLIIKCFDVDRERLTDGAAPTGAPDHTVIDSRGPSLSFFLKRNTTNKTFNYSLSLDSQMQSRIDCRSKFC